MYYNALLYKEVSMYYNEITNNNIVYSIDMLRLKTYISYSLFSEIEFRFKTVWKNYIKKEYTTPSLQSFYYNYVVSIDEDNSFWFGFCHNTEMRSTNDKLLYNFTIEFNPNKIKDNKILMYLLNLSGEWYIKSYDLALDIKVSILDIIFDMSGKHSSMMLNNGFDDKTIYLGKGENRVKIYNKKRESNLNINGELTRIEISHKMDDFNISDTYKLKFDGKFPSLYLNKYLYSFDIYNDKTLLAILFAVQNNFPINDLSRAYKKKIKALLEGGYKICFNTNDATQALRKTIFSYFINNKKVKFK